MPLFPGINQDGTFESAAVRAEVDKRAAAKVAADIATPGTAVQTAIGAQTDQAVVGLATSAEVPNLAATRVATDISTPGTPIQTALNAQTVQVTVAKGIIPPNLFRPEQVHQFGVTTSSVITAADYQGYTVPVKPGEVYSVSRSGTTASTRFRVGFTANPPAYGEPVIGHTDYGSALKAEGIVVPDGMAYMVWFFSVDKTPLPDIKIERGTQATEFSLAPVDFIRQNALQVREAPLTPYRFGAKSGDPSEDHTVPLRDMFNVAKVGGAEIYLPPGYWTTKGATGGALPLASGTKITGAGRSRTTLRASTGAPSLFTWDSFILGVEMDSLSVQTASNSGHIFNATSGITHGTFRNMSMVTNVNTSRIWHQDGATAFIQMLFDSVEMQRDPTSTVAPFYVRNSQGSANCNAFYQVRANGLNNTSSPFFHIESTHASAYATDWSWMNIIGEQNPAGLIHMYGSSGVLIMASSDEDAHAPYVGDVFGIYKGGLEPRDSTFINSGRRGQSMSSGKSDFHVSPAGSGATFIGCNPNTTNQTSIITAPANAVYLSTRRGPSNRWVNSLGGPTVTGTYATASRPVAADSGHGALIFDSTLNKPLWSNGAAWVDAMGAVV